eukprot:1842367-Pleurochrysis_carterae.AAC.1
MSAPSCRRLSGHGVNGFRSSLLCVRPWARRSRLMVRHPVGGCGMRSSACGSETETACAKAVASAKPTRCVCTLSVT